MGGGSSGIIIAMGCAINKSQTSIHSNPSSREEAKHLQTFKINPSVFIQENDRDFSQIYRVGKSIGSGGYGDVRKCTHRETKVQRAVKIFRKDLIPSGQLESGSLFQEIDIMRTLDHPNIVRVYEYFEDARRIFIVMELCKGGELFTQIVKRNHFTENQAAIIMKQLFSAVSYLHSRNIIHRDLKPENILLEDGEASLNIKLIDFGAATFFHKHKRLTGKLGTAYYVAPEVLQGAYDEKCDMWSCGVILFILLSGHPPFKGDNTGEILEKIEQRDFSTSDGTWTSVSKEGIEIVNQILVPAAQRITAQQALSHRWIQNFATATALSQGLLANVLVNLKSFHSATKLKDAVLTFLTSQALSLQDTKELREVFRSIDKNGDGKLSREELLDKYKETMVVEAAEQEVDKIMREVDADGSGYIDYIEFLKASTDESKLLSKQNLAAAFALFDKDGSGTISAAEIRRVLEGGSMMDDHVWNELVQQVDQNGDGEVDLKEFEELLLAKI